jgi:thiosulfate/3-mercaptopyruvate sulfurtransferase
MAAELRPLVDAETLMARLDDAELRLFDASVRLVRPPGGGPYAVQSGRDGYLLEHIPGAAFADIPGELSDPDARFPFTLPPAELFAAAAGRLGIGPDSHVVVYAQESPMWATRLWWLLRFFGHDAVSVLDGGLPAWKAAGKPTDVSEHVYPPTTFAARPRPELLATRADVERIVAHGDACLINALQPQVFRGEGVTSYSRPGRIPGSVNTPWTGLVDADGGRFLAPAQMQDVFERAGALGDEDVVAYCGGGISATVALFSLFLLGNDSARLYDGSLSEWTADPSLPVEMG